MVNLTDNIYLHYWFMTYLTAKDISGVMVSESLK